MSDAGAIDPRSLLPGYVCGSLSDDERSLVERRLVEDAGLARELREWEELLGQLAEGAAPVVEPSPESRRLLLERVAAQVPAAGGAASSTAEPFARRRRDDAVQAATATAARRGRSLLVPALALAASLAAVLLSLVALRQQSAGRAELAALRSERERLDRHVAALESEVEGAGRRLDDLASAVRAATFPGRQPILLAGLEGAPDASGATFYHPASRDAVFHAFGLPGLSADRTYQLWYILDSGPVSAGIFGVDQRGEASLAVAGLPEPGRIKTWAVSVEPAGGVDQPSGPIVAASS